MNDMRIVTTLEWVDDESGEINKVMKESMGSTLNIRSAFESAEENLGKLESYINRLIAKGEETKQD